ncbi:MAG: hypothetical protein V3V05_01445 [Pontiella sp.]
MDLLKYEDMVRGWFIGNFDPSALKTNDVEVALQEYEAGDYDERHYHKIATEITLIVEGEVEMNGVQYSQGDIVVIHPGESTDFRALTKAKNVVVKIPGVNHDKYMGDME